MILSASEVREIALATKLPHEELAHTLSVSERTLRRWKDHGVEGAPAVLLALVHRCIRMGVGWRPYEVIIYLGRGTGLRVLDDDAVFERLHGLKREDIAE